MKKLLTVLLCLLLLCGCGNKNESQNNKPEENNTAENSENETIQVDEGLLDVTITLPSSFFEQFDTTAEEYIKSMDDDGNLFKKVDSNNDGSVSITMTRAKYNEMMTELEKSVDESIKEMVDSGEYALKSVDHDKKFENFIVNLSTNEIGFAESFMVIAFAMYGGIYQLFDGNQNPHVVVKYVGPDGTELETWDSTQMED